MFAQFVPGTEAIFASDHELRIMQRDCVFGEWAASKDCFETVERSSIVVPG